jgi:hypothetical protein
MPAELVAADRVVSNSDDKYSDLKQESRDFRIPLKLAARYEQIDLFFFPGFAPFCRLSISGTLKKAVIHKC